MRRVVFWGHLGTAVLLGSIVLIKAVTGLVLSFERQTVAWVDGRHQGFAQPAAGTPPLATDRLLTVVAQARPEARVQSVTLSAQPDRVTTLGTAGGRSLFVDPYTGDIVGESSATVRAFFSDVLAWHRWFGVDGSNRAVARSAGAAGTLGFLLLAVSGVYLWVPRVWTRARWRFATWFRRGLPARGRDLNWHQVIGVWMAAPLIVVLASGVIMSYDWANALLYRAVGDTVPRRDAPGDAAPARRAGRRDEARIASLSGLDAFRPHAAEYAPHWHTLTTRVPNASPATLTVTVDEGDGGQPQRRGTATIAAATGAVVSWEPFADLSAGRRARSLARFLHTGEAGGVAGQLIAALAMVAALVLAWTGFAMAWRRAMRWLPAARPDPRLAWPVAAAGVAALVVGWQMVTDAGAPNPLAHADIAWLDIAVLVFREGLECVLVLSAITASMVGATRHYRRPVAAGALAALVATVLTWFGAARVIDDLTRSLPALAVQAATGLVAVVVLLVVMNWFFHKVYWTGWIAAHTNRKRELLTEVGRARQGHGAAARPTSSRVLLGLAALGFTSFYREGVEVVLFLQSYRMRLGSGPVAWGVAIGAALTAVLAVATFVLQRRLPYKRMLVVTGVLLGGVLLVMVGEQAQEMQQAGWLPTTEIPWLASRLPSWMGLWLSVFPTVETLVAQALAALLVVGSYAGASRQRMRDTRRAGLDPRSVSDTPSAHSPMALSHSPVR